MKYTIRAKRKYEARNPDMKNEKFPEFNSEREAQEYFEGEGMDYEYYSIVKSLPPKSQSAT